METVGSTEALGTSDAMGSCDSDGKMLSRAGKAQQPERELERETVYVARTITCIHKSGFEDYRAVSQKLPAPLNYGSSSDTVLAPFSRTMGRYADSRSPQS